MSTGNNHTLHYPRPPFAEQPQRAPGLASEMKPIPDHGETSYIGSGKLAGKKALITGGDSGIGRAVAIAYAREGADVAIGYLPEEESDAASVIALIQAEGRKAVAIPGDIRVESFCDTLVEKAVAELGGLDILVNNAGITQPIKLMDIKRENYDAVLDVSLRGTLLMSQAVIPTMRAQKSGSIVCISSVSAQRGGGIFGGPHYSAAKAGVLGLAKAMARELGPDNVRVNCITPGLIQTDITAGKLSDEMKTSILAGIPLNRLGDAQDIARAALFLGSDLSSYSTGITLDVNGGMLIH